MIDRDGLELEAADAVLAVDLLLDLRVADALADVLVHRVIGEAEVILVGQARQSVGRRLDQEALRKAQLRADGDDLLRGVHADGGECAGAVTVDRAVAHPVLREVGGVDHDAALHALRDGIERRHADAGGKIDRRLAAGLDADVFHLVQHAGSGCVNIEGIMANAQDLDQTVAVIDIGLDAVRHQHAHHVLAPVGRDAQRGDHAGVLAAGNADHGGFAAAIFHLRTHPVQKTGKLLLCIEFVHGATSSLVCPIVPQARRICKPIPAARRRFQSPAAAAPDRCRSRSGVRACGPARRCRAA